MTDQTHLFTVRIWREALDDDTREIRGRVKHVPTGRWRHFRTWNDLRTFLDTLSDDNTHTKKIL
jgi:hypothetical protein